MCVCVCRAPGECAIILTVLRERVYSLCSLQCYNERLPSVNDVYTRAHRVTNHNLLLPGVNRPQSSIG